MTRSDIVLQGVEQFRRESQEGRGFRAMERTAQVPKEHCERNVPTGRMCRVGAEMRGISAVRGGAWMGGAFLCKGGLSERRDTRYYMVQHE